MDHQHQHHHHEDGGDRKGLGQRNEEHFDQHASTIFDEDWIKKITTQVQDELRKEVDWIGIGASNQNAASSGKMLDYACGNGVASRALEPYMAKTRGIDISSAMAGQFNKRAKEEGFAEDKMRAVHGDLLEPSAKHSADVDTAEYRDFDLAIMSLALHHVEHTETMVQKLADRLKEGGILLILDFVDPVESGCAQPGTEHPGKHMVSKLGFTQGEMKRLFEKAGLESWGYRWFTEKTEMPGPVGEQQIFMARGVKTGAAA